MALPSNTPVQRQYMLANGTNGHGYGDGKIIAVAHRVTERARSLNGLMGSIGGPVECPMEITGLANSGPSQLDAHRWQLGDGYFYRRRVSLLSPKKAPISHAVTHVHGGPKADLSVPWACQSTAMPINASPRLCQLQEHAWHSSTAAHTLHLTSFSPWPSLRGQSSPHVIMPHNLCACVSSCVCVHNGAELWDDGRRI